MSHRMKAEKSQQRQVQNKNLTDADALYTSVLTIFIKDLPESWSETRDTLLSYIRKKDFRALYQASEDLSSSTFDSARDQFLASQIAALVLKYPDEKKFSFEKTPEQTAKEKFQAAEDACKKSNRRFARINNSLEGTRSRFSPLLDYMREWILRTLGESPDMQEIYSKCGFGIGSNIGTHGNSTNFGRKFEGKWTVTSNAIQFALPAIHSNTQWRFHLLTDGETERIACDSAAIFSQKFSERVSVVSHNKISFVPKTAKTKRSIAVEPLLNSLIQKGIDQYMRTLLCRVGYDLTDQGRNQHLAKMGSLDGSLATIDLSSASDSIATQLVRFLLPANWWGLLSLTRSPNYLLDGVTRRYEKFVSMGNGFCFPLETLIFASAVKACKHALNRRSGLDAVYGDDIIVEREIAPLLISLLRFIGFKTNTAKTFLEGPFRESCGADWYRGQDVRPVYLDFLLSDATAVRIFHNATLRGDFTRSSFEGIRAFLRSAVDPKGKLLRPDFGQAKWTSLRKYERLENANLNGAFTVPLDVFMSSRSARWNRYEQRWSWNEILFVPRLDRVRRTPYSRYLLFLQGNQEGLAALRYQAVARRVLI